jgi:hypothetical protein
MASVAEFNRELEPPKLRFARWKSLSATLILLFCAFGCGGSGGSNFDSTPPVSAFRPNAVGDSWTYAVTTNLPYVGNGSGTFVEALVSDTYLGNPSIKETQTFNLNYPQGPNVLSTFNELSTSGALLAVISNGLVTPVKSDTFTLGPTLTSTTNVSGTLTLADGTVIQESYKVTGSQWVNVPAGRFNCWVATETEIQNNGTRNNYTLFVAPEVGTWVKAEAQTLYSGGQQFDWVAQLSSTTNSIVPSSPKILTRPLPPRTVFSSGGTD